MGAAPWGARCGGLWPGPVRCWMIQRLLGVSGTAGVIYEKRPSLAADLPREAACMTSTSIFTAAMKTVTMPPPMQIQACSVLAGKAVLMVSGYFFSYDSP